MEIDFTGEVGVLSGDIYFLRHQGCFFEEKVEFQRFKKYIPPDGNNFELLALTHPELLAQAYADYLAAGVKILKTNTFSASIFSQAEYFRTDKQAVDSVEDQKWFQELLDDTFLIDLVDEINQSAVEIVKTQIKKAQLEDGEPRYIAGTIGPCVSLSCALSEDGVSRTSVDYDQVVAMYRHQAETLVSAGVEIILIDSVFDALNGKAALEAVREVLDKARVDLPIIVTVAIGPMRDLMISSEAVCDFYEMIKPFAPAVLGVSESHSFDDSMEMLTELRSVSIPILYYPEVCLISDGTLRFESPEEFAKRIKPCYEAGLFNLVGGCYGITPKHIAELNRLVKP